MKKRIGTKLFDTDTSDLVCESALGQIFRKKTGLGEYFSCKDGMIIPLEYETAKDIIKACDPAAYDRLFVLRGKDTVKKILAISISDYDKLRLRRMSAKRKMSMSEYISWLVEQDENRTLNKQEEE